MVLKYEKYPNSAFNWLSQNVGTGDLTINVYDARRFPGDGNFRIKVDDEIMGVTSVNTVDHTLVVVRAQEGTVAKTHSLDSLVIAVLTGPAFDQILTDRVLYAKQRPQYGHILDASGLILTVSDMTWNNQGSATATDVNGTIWMNGSRSTGNDSHGLLDPAPGSTPWTFTLGWRPFVANNNFGTDGFPNSGILLKDSLGSTLIHFGVYNRQGVVGGASDGNLKTSVEYMTNATTHSSTPAVRGYQRRYDEVMWHRVTDNGTNLLFDVSRDGVNWINFQTLGRTAHLTNAPDRVGFFIDPWNADAAGGTGMDCYAAFVHASYT
jgi:hypothetical protein